MQVSQWVVLAMIAILVTMFSFSHRGHSAVALLHGRIHPSIHPSIGTILTPTLEIISHETGPKRQPTTPNRTLPTYEFQVSSFLLAFRFLEGNTFQLYTTQEKVPLVCKTDARSLPTHGFMCWETRISKATIRNSKKWRLRRRGTV